MQEWKKAVEKIVNNPGTCLILGKSDSGKSTFAAYLANFLVENNIVPALVDSDIGQSDIGPPGTIGTGIVRKKIYAMKQIKPICSYFIGSNSPRGVEAHCAIGTFRMVEHALNAGAQIAIIDTTGYIAGQGARTLKHHKIELVRPKYVILLQHHSEIEHLIPLIGKRGDAHIFKLPVHPNVRKRTQNERKLTRQKKYSRHFSAFSKLDLYLEDIRTNRTFFKTGNSLDFKYKKRFSNFLKCRILHAEVVPEGLYLIYKGYYRREGLYSLKNAEKVHRIVMVEQHEFQNLLVGLLDEKGKLLDIGILHEIDYDNNRALISSHPDIIQEVKEICMGTLKITKEGREIGSRKTV